MVKRKTCLGVLIPLFFIAGCAKEKQNPVTPVNKPTNLLELQNLLPFLLYLPLFFPWERLFCAEMKLPLYPL